MLTHILSVPLARVFLEGGKNFLLQKRVVMDEAALCSARLQNGLLKP
jgi:hypothetical protein